MILSNHMLLNILITDILSPLFTVPSFLLLYIFVVICICTPRIIRLNNELSINGQSLAPNIPLIYVSFAIYCNADGCSSQCIVRLIVSMAVEVLILERLQDEDHTCLYKKITE